MREALNTLAGKMEPTHLFLTRIVLAALLILVVLYGNRLLEWTVKAVGRRVQLHLPHWMSIIAQCFTEPLMLFLRILLLYVTALLIPIPEIWTNFISSWITPLIRACAVLFAAWGFWRAAPLCRLLLRGAQDKLDIHTNQTIGRFIENIYRATVVLFALLTVLEMLGVPVVSLVAGAGLVGLAISLAAQSMLTNLLAGIMLVIERPFGIGDFIVLGEFYGTVEDISFRSTRLRTPDNVLITVENTKVCSEYIQNGNERDSRLWSFTLRLSYDTPMECVDMLCDEIRILLLSSADIKDDPLSVTLHEISEDGIKVLVRAYTTTADYNEYLRIRDEINRRILVAVGKCGCHLVYPSASVYMEETDRNRS